MLGNEAPNVVTKEGFRGLMDEGYDALVVAQEDAERKNNQWNGRWSVWALGGKGRGDRILVSTRGITAGGLLDAREFKTTFGLIGFLQEMGYSTVAIPLEKGVGALQVRPAARATGGAEASR